MALNAVPVDERTNEKNPHLVALFNGLQGCDYGLLVYQLGGGGGGGGPCFLALTLLLTMVCRTQSIMYRTFEKHGLVRVDPLGQKFDPNQVLCVFVCACVSVCLSVCVNSAAAWHCLSLQKPHLTACSTRRSLSCPTPARSLAPSAS
jgi:hypothetical protein